MQKSVYFIVSVLLAIGLVNAAVITIQTQVTVGDGNLSIETTNLGDEAAYNVRLDVNDITSQAIKTLTPEESFVFVTDDKKFMEQGSFPVIVKTFYEDGNGYPFSAVSVSVTGRTKQGISVSAKDTSSGSDKEVEVEVTNLEDDDKDVNISLVYPDTITVINPKQRILLGPFETKIVNFRLEKLTGLQGSTYAFFAVGEYEEEDSRQVQVGNGVIDYNDQTNKQNLNNIFIIILVILIGIFIIGQKNQKKYLKFT